LGNVCETLSQIKEAMAAYAARFDAARGCAGRPGEVVALAGAIEAMAATVKGLAAAHDARSGAWRVAGERSAAHALAHASGSSVGSALATLDTARRLEALPATAAAARAGELSAQQTALIADAATADPGAEGGLLAQAATGASLAELRAECTRIRAAAEPDPEARWARIRAGRFLRSYTDTDGSWQLRVRHLPEAGAQVMAALAPLTDAIFRAARVEGRREAPEAYAADALVELARSAGSAPATIDADQADGGPRQARGDQADGGPRQARGVPAKIIVRIDWSALLRGYPSGGEAAEIAGLGPVAVSAVREMIASGDPFLAAVVTKGEAVAQVAHLGRRPRAIQRTALEWLAPACAVLGCAAQARLEIDHRIDWSASHITLLEALDRLCSHHHDLKTNHGWALVDADGHPKRAFVPPDDPCHPRHKQRGGTGATGPPPQAA